MTTDTRNRINNFVLLALVGGCLLALVLIIGLNWSCSRPAGAHSSTPAALEPAIIAKFLRARADFMDKQVELNRPVDQVVEEARLDCKAKGFAVDAKGNGLVNLDGNGLLSCVQKPPSPPAPAPTSPAAPAAVQEGKK
jgi:hypothetical protein